MPTPNIEHMIYTLSELLPLRKREDAGSLGGVVRCGGVEGGAAVIVLHVNRLVPVVAPSWSVSVGKESSLEELYCGEVILRYI